jgi:flagellar biosynthesis/type III secretory pathway chaperone
MHATLNDLVDVLRTEAALYRELLQAMDREQVVMIRSRLDELGPVAANKQTLLGRLHAVERQRSELIGRLAGRFGCAPAELTLSRIARTAPSPHGEALWRCRADLSDLLKRLREENRRSEVLCRHTSDLLRASYGVVNGLALNSPVYHRGGRMQGTQLNGKLVCDEI